MIQLSVSNSWLTLRRGPSPAPLLSAGSFSALTQENTTGAVDGNWWVLESPGQQQGLFAQEQQ